MKLTLALSADRVAIYRLSSQTELPPGTEAARFFSLTRTRQEISLIIDSDICVPAERYEHDLRYFRVLGPLSFDLVGILRDLSDSLAKSDVPILSVSTFETDYLFVRTDHLDRAMASLRNAGFIVRDE